MLSRRMSSCFAFLALVSVTPLLHVDAIEAGGGGFALRFDGSNDYVQLPSFPQMTTNFTIELWLHTCTAAPHQAFFSKYATDGTAQFGLGSGVGQINNPSDLLMTYFVPFSPEITPNTFKTPVPTTYLQQPIHLAVTAQSLSASSSRLVMYIDGNVVANQTTSTRLDISATNRVSLGWNLGTMWGRDPGIMQRQHALCGTMDELRFWSEPRTRDDIQRLMYSELLAADKTAQLVAYYNFDTPVTGTGLTVTDNSGLNNPAYLGNILADEAPVFVPSPFPLTGAKLVVDTEEGLPVTFDMTRDPSVPLDAFPMIVSLPVNGTLSVSDNGLLTTIDTPGVNITNTSITYTPPAHGAGIPFASFLYALCSPVAGNIVCSSSQTVELRVMKHFEPVAGIAGSALLDGTSGYFELSDFMLATTSTFELWMTLPSSGSCLIFTKHTIEGDNSIIFTWITSGGGILLLFWRGITLSVPFPLGVNEPTHMAFTLAPLFNDGSGLNCTFYKNGVAVNPQGAAAPAADLSPYSGLPWSIGQEFDRSPSGKPVPSDFIRGNLDEIRIWQVTRTPAEILANYRHTLRGDEPGLYAYYNFDLELTPQEATTLPAVKNLAPASRGGPDLKVIRTKPTSVQLLATSPIPIPGSPMAVQVRENLVAAIQLAVGSSDPYVCIINSLPTSGDLSLPDGSPIATVPFQVDHCLVRYHARAGHYFDAIQYTARTRLYEARFPSTVDIDVLWSGPRITLLQAGDPYNADDVFSSADTLTIEFDVDTDQPVVNAKADLDSLFAFRPPLPPGVNYVGQWATPRVCVITFANVPAAVLRTMPAELLPRVGNLTVQVVGPLYRAGGASTVSDNVSPVLTGNWGVPPARVEWEYPTASASGVIAIGAIEAAACAALLLVLFLFRDRPLLRAASPLFLGLTVAGALLGIVLSILLATNAQPTPERCTYTFVVGAVAFALCFGSLFAKTYRLHRVFNTKKLQKVTMPNEKLLTLVVGIVAGEVALVLILNLPNPPTVSTLVLTGPDNTLLVVRGCEFPTGNLLVFYLAQVLFACWGIYLAAQTRNIPSHFNEVKVIGGAIYNVSLTCGILVPIVILLNEQPTLQVSLQSYGILFIVCTTMCILFGTRLMPLTQQADGRETKIGSSADATAVTGVPREANNSGDHGVGSGRNNNNNNNNNGDTGSARGNRGGNNNNNNGPNAGTGNNNVNGNNFMQQPNNAAAVMRSGTGKSALMSRGANDDMVNAGTGRPHTGNNSGGAGGGSGKSKSSLGHPSAQQYVVRVSKPSIEDHMGPTSGHGANNPREGSSNGHDSHREHSGNHSGNNNNNSATADRPPIMVNTFATTGNGTARSRKDMDLEDPTSDVKPVRAW